MSITVTDTLIKVDGEIDNLVDYTSFLYSLKSIKEYREAGNLANVSLPTAKYVPQTPLSQLTIQSQTPLSQSAFQSQTPLSQLTLRPQASQLQAATTTTTTTIVTAATTATPLKKGRKPKYPQKQPEPPRTKSSSKSKPVTITTTSSILFPSAIRNESETSKDERPLDASKLKEMYVDGVKRLLEVSFASEIEAATALKTVIVRVFHQLSAVKNHGRAISEFICNKVVSDKAEKKRKSKNLTPQEETEDPVEHEGTTQLASPSKRAIGKMKEHPVDPKILFELGCTSEKCAWKAHMRKNGKGHFFFSDVSLLNQHSFSCFKGVSNNASGALESAYKTLHKSLSPYCDYVEFNEIYLDKVGFTFKKKATLIGTPTA